VKVNVILEILLTWAHIPTLVKFGAKNVNFHRFGTLRSQTAVLYRCGRKIEHTKQYHQGTMISLLCFVKKINCAAIASGYGDRRVSLGTFYQYVSMVNPLCVFCDGQSYGCGWTMSCTCFPTTKYPQRERGPGHVTDFLILGPRYIYEMATDCNLVCRWST